MIFLNIDTKMSLHLTYNAMHLTLYELYKRTSFIIAAGVSRLDV